MNDLNLFEMLAKHKAVEALPYNPEWQNGTGYFDRAVVGKHAPDLSPGKIYITTDQHNRTILLAWTRFGNAVFFKRYAENQGPWVCNVPSEVNRFFCNACSSALTDEQIIDIMGIDQYYSSYFDNGIGDKIEAFFRAVERLMNARAADSEINQRLIDEQQEVVRRVSQYKAHREDMSQRLKAKSA